MLPAANPAFLARGALILDGAVLADIGPVAAQGQSLFLVCVVVDQALASWAKIDIVCGHIDKVLLSKPALGLAARGQRFGRRDRDPGITAGQDLFAIEVATVGNDIQLVCRQGRLGPLGHG